jgi:2,3-dihydroxybenzoate decarboxylase
MSEREESGLTRREIVKGGAIAAAGVAAATMLPGMVGTAEATHPSAERYAKQNIADGLEQLPIAGAPTKPRPPLRKIAIEEHFMNNEATNPEGKFDAENFVKVSGLDMNFFKTVIKRMSDLRDKRIKEMDLSLIDVSILSLTSAGIEGIADSKKAVVAAKKVNDFLSEEIAASNGRYQGFASVALQDPAEAVKELDRAVRQLKMKGVMINGYANIGSDYAYLDQPEYYPFWEKTCELGIPVYIHPRSAFNNAQYRNHPELIGATWGFAPETATHALRIVYGGIFDRFPKATLILGHLGEMLPYFAWRIQHCFEWNPGGKSTEKRLQDYLSENIYITTSGNCSDQALITCLLTVGADRIMFASDYPFEMSTDAARWIEEAPMAEGDRKKIAGLNAKKLFKL